LPGDINEGAAIIGEYEPDARSKTETINGPAVESAYAQCGEWRRFGNGGARLGGADADMAGIERGRARQTIGGGYLREGAIHQNDAEGEPHQE
jgi:hypothetical protein